MKNIFKIYKKDLKDIFTNLPLLVVAISIAVLPSLYAWFNIKASWDPYGSTGNISVAIINEDKGAEVFNKDVNVGQKLIDKLKDNKTLGWQFVDKKTALEGVEKGTYYASVEIPANFSKDLTSLVTEDIKKGEIIYTVNEKINAIAPKITDKGASTIQLQVNETVVKTVSEIIFEIFNEVGVQLENQLPKLTNVENSLVEVQGKFSTIDKTINSADNAAVKIEDIIKQLQGDIPSIKTTIDNSKKLSGDLKAFLEDTKSSMGQIAPIIKNDLTLISDVSSNVSSATSDIMDAINKGAENAPALVDGLYNKISNLSNTSKTLTELLKKLDKFTPGHPLKDAVAQLESINSKLDTALAAINTVKGQIANGQKPSLDNLNKILTIANDINAISSSIVNNFDSQIVNPINSLFEQSFVVAGNVIEVLEKAEAKLPAVEDILNTSLDFSGNAQESLKFIKEKIPKAKNIVNELVDTMHKINTSKDIDELVSLLKSDIISRSNFLEQPVQLVTEKLYPVANYGASMTPFYTVLSLWVGVLLLMSLFSTEAHGEYKPTEIYFGRGLTFLSLALVQGLIVSAGDIYFLNVKVLNPALFILLSMFTSAVFTFIVYSLVSVFGNVGKAMGVILLVIQVAASGGTFPIQVTPQFFQNVNPFLPFTYAINALREAVAGVYVPNLQKDIIILLIFLVVSLVVNVFLKGPINRLLAKPKAKYNESDLTGH
ncbi:YhgE/Pip domain-containing protein [Romboutsia weinsteinii]|uniref:YhgE/Pip domain-containing protein n=1 Tax=Romboutsia weinsteinii TaxID=2020949 RepID=A0A371J9K4_9FIRM|nr:YhgE/Pip domain-containing protein [Romboutsia weinsteinii]RDY29425.1 YhgE/Pip domain-containing protein [Romboutsia weinsteinii]